MKLACIGDSFTRGFKVKPSEAWPTLLEEKLGIEALNLGINGDTTAGMLARFRQDVTESEPSRVIIAGGVNDLILRGTTDTACANIATMVHHARHYRITPVIGIEPPVIPDMAEQYWPGITDFWKVNLELAELRLKLLSFAKAFRVEVADFNSQLELSGAVRRELYSDGLHLTAEGNRMIVDAVQWMES